MTPLAAVPTANGESFNLIQLLLHATGVVQAVLFLLVCLSIIGWYVIGYKWYSLARAQSDSVKFLDAFWKSKRLDDVFQVAGQRARSPIANMFKAGYVELVRLQQAKTEDPQHVSETSDDLEAIERALRRSATSESTVLEGMVPFLATVGSAAPFIGLFGTVVGIIDTFEQIAHKGSASLQSVGPGIAEALGTTAVGLIAAVPAVMAYNYFARRVKVLMSEMDAFSNDFLNIVKRHFLR